MKWYHMEFQIPKTFTVQQTTSVWTYCSLKVHNVLTGADNENTVFFIFYIQQTHYDISLL